MDWDQPLSIYLSATCGPEANADFALLRQRISKYADADADAAPAFEAVARRRELITDYQNKPELSVWQQPNFSLSRRVGLEFCDGGFMNSLNQTWQHVLECVF